MFLVKIKDKRLKIKDDTFQAVFITTNQKETKFINKTLDGYVDYSTFETSTYIKENWEKFDLEMLIAYEEKYDCKPIWSYIYTDRFLVNRDYE